MSARSFLGSWGSGPPSSAPSASGPASARRPGTPTGGDGLGRLLTDARAGVARPAAGVVFVSGTLATRIGQVAALVRDVWKGVPALVVPGAGVIAERGEVEGASAASGVLWAGGRATPFAVGESAGGFRDGLVAAATEAAAGARAPTVLLFPRPDAFDAASVEDVTAIGPEACLFGGGSVGGAALALTASGQVLEGAAAGLVVSGLAAPIVDAAPACRLLSEFAPIDEVSGGMVLSVGGRPALDLLSSASSGLPAPASGPAGAQPVIFAALADTEPTRDGEPRYMVRPVRGIDPARRGVLVGPDAQPGTPFAFAVREAAAAKAALDASARRVARQAAGAAPRFALYLSCSGRGQSLYRAPDVEARLLRQRFGDLPIAGMHSAFEITSWGPGRARMQLFTGVLALFRSPS